MHFDACLIKRFFPSYEAFLIKTSFYFYLLILFYSSLFLDLRKQAQHRQKPSTRMRLKIEYLLSQLAHVSYLFFYSTFTPLDLLQQGVHQKSPYCSIPTVLVSPSMRFEQYLQVLVILRISSGLRISRELKSQRILRLQLSLMANPYLSSIFLSRLKSSPQQKQWSLRKEAVSCLVREKQLHSKYLYALLRFSSGQFWNLSLFWTALHIQEMQRKCEQVKLRKCFIWSMISRQAQQVIIFGILIADLELLLELKALLIFFPQVQFAALLQPQQIGSDSLQQTQSKLSLIPHLKHCIALLIQYLINNIINQSKYSPIFLKIGSEIPHLAGSFINPLDYLRLLNLNYIQMADVSLDDLIKKDKEQHKTNRDNKKFNNKKFPPRKFQDHQEKPQNPNRPQEDQRPFKSKFIKKQFEGNRSNFREDREQRGEKFSRPLRQQRQERSQSEGQEKEKQFRTLKVMGLSPEFTNEDLFKLFAAEGALEKCLIEQDNFGRSLTTAIVKYHGPDSAKSAIQNLNRHKVMNCVLTVEPYKNNKQ